MDLLPIVLGLLAAVAVLLAVGFVASRFVLSGNAKRARAALPPIGPRDVEESAVGLTAPFKAYGVLRLTPAELYFAGGSTAGIMTVARSQIVACMASEDIPTGVGMQTLKRKALVVQLRHPELPQGVAFMVSDPAAWVQRLRS